MAAAEADAERQTDHIHQLVDQLVSQPWNQFLGTIREIQACVRKTAPWTKGTVETWEDTLRCAILVVCQGLQVSTHVNCLTVRRLHQRIASFFHVSAVTQELVRLFQQLAEFNAALTIRTEPELANVIASSTFQGLWRNTKLMSRCGGQLVFSVAAVWAAADALADSEPWALAALDMFSGATTCTLDARNPASPSFFAAVLACSSLLRRAQGADLATLLPATQQLARTAAKPTLKDKEAVAVIQAVHSALNPNTTASVALEPSDAPARTAAPWGSLGAAQAAAVLLDALRRAHIPQGKGVIWQQVMMGVALTLRLLCAHSSDRQVAELTQAALAAEWPPMQAVLEGRAYDSDGDAAHLRPPAAAAAAGPGAAAAPPAGAAAAAAAQADTQPARRRGAPVLGVTLANDVSDIELLKEYGVPVPVHLLPEASTLSKLLSDPAQAAEEVQVANPASSYFARKERNVCVGVLEAFAERGMARTDGWFDAPIPDVLDGRSSWAFLRDLQHFIVAPFGTGIRPSAVNAVVALLGSPCALPRAWVVDSARVIITAAADTDAGLTPATYDALTTLCVWRLPLADVTSLILDNMCGKATPLSGPALPAVMAVGGSSAGLVGATPPTMSTLSAVAPPRLQRTLLWLTQAMRHARVSDDAGDSSDEKRSLALLADLRSRDTSHMSVQPVCMRTSAWLHLGQALGVALQHRNAQVRDAAAVALGEALSLVGDSPALREMMQEVDLLKAARMVAAWTAGGNRRQGGKAARQGQRATGRRGAPTRGGIRMGRTEKLMPAPSPPSLPLSVPAMALVGGVPAFVAADSGAAEHADGDAARKDSSTVEVTELRSEPLLYQSTALWERLGLVLPRAPFSLAFVPTLRHLSERKLAQEILQQEEDAVGLDDKEAETAVGEVVASAGNLLYTAVELRAYKLQLVCLLMLRRHARIVARIKMLQALPLDLQKLLGRYSIPNKAASMSFASHRRAIRAAASSDLTAAGFLGSLGSLWGMKEMQPQLVKYFCEHYQDILSAVDDALPELVTDAAGACSVAVPQPPSSAADESAPANSPAKPRGVLVLNSGMAGMGRFSCIGVPSSFMTAVLSAEPETGHEVPATDAFLLFAHWLRDAIKQPDSAQGANTASSCVAFPPGVLDADVRAIAWDCLRPDAMSPGELTALAAAHPTAFAMLSGVKVLKGMQAGT